MGFVKSGLCLALGVCVLALAGCTAVAEDPVYFWSTGSGNYSNSAITSWATINMVNEVADIGDDFDLVTSTFTAPLDGLYHFDASTSYGFVTYPASATYRFAIFGIFVNAMNSPVQYVKVFVGDTVTTSMSLSVTLQLTAGDKVAVRAMSYFDINTGGLGASGEYFGGYLVQ